MRKILIFIVIFIVTCSRYSTAQSPFYMEYKFRLYNETGHVLTNDSLVYNTLFIIPNPGKIIATSFNDTTHFFSVRIRTTWPLFRLIWNRYNRIMEFSVDHLTLGKIIYVDSLVFHEGRYYIADDEQSWWKGLNIKITEDETSIHLKKINYPDFKTSESYLENKKLKKVKITKPHK